MSQTKGVIGPATKRPRLLGLLFGLLLVSSGFLALSPHNAAQAAARSNAAAQAATNNGNLAIQYADSHWNCTDAACDGTVSQGDGQPDFQCAEFVARSLSAEGLIPGLGPNSPQSAYASYVAKNGQIYNLLWIGYVTPPNGLKQYLLDNGLAVEVGNNPAAALPGDVAIYPGSGGDGHTALLVQTGTTVNGSDTLADAHNNAAYHVSYAMYSSSDILHITSNLFALSPGSTGVYQYRGANQWGQIGYDL